jgi:hypothetical protein
MKVVCQEISKETVTQVKKSIRKTHQKSFNKGDVCALFESLYPKPNEVDVLQYANFINRCSDNFLKTHRLAGEIVYDHSEKEWNWVPKNKQSSVILYEYRFKDRDGYWNLDTVFKTEEQAIEAYGDIEYKRTGRKFLD